PPPPPSFSATAKPPPFLGQLSLRGCNLCVSAKLEAPVIDIRPYRFDNKTCKSIQQNISNIMNDALAKANISYNRPFKMQDTLCFADLAVTCGLFNLSFVEDQQLESTIRGVIPSLAVLVTGGDVCRPELQYYGVEIHAEAPSCVDQTTSTYCDPPGQPQQPKAPFPNCTCNTTQGVLPFTVSPTYYPQTSVFFGQQVIEYCFTIDTVPRARIVPSTCYAANDPLAKVEWYANETLRSVVKGFSATPAGGTSKKVSANWGPQGTNTLKVTLNWMEKEASGGVVCVAIQEPYTLDDLCLGASGQCFISLFNTNSEDYCCPFFSTTSI
ncbi:hypothetical protein VaNZ11_008704, partial [Volvox africanus]